ncbi:MAG: DUF3253 domain-containing protein [Labrys sp. (in: a-proteobacteria)]|jgi:hypothetical protein
MTDPAEIEETILRLAGERGPDKTICPSEAARALVGSDVDAWGPLMQPLKRVAMRMAREGRIVLYRKGKSISPDDLRGIYRIGVPRHD